MAPFRVVAIIAAKNEADIISQVIEDLIRQAVEVYLIDDGSTDETVPEASRWLNRGLLSIERRRTSTRFDWTGLLRRKEQVAAELSADWFIHHDADEFRESPWAHLNLRDAIRAVDALGYSAVDFRVLNFRPTDDTFVPGSDVRAALRFYEPAAPHDVVQVKAWKRQADGVDLVSSGGHEARFEGRRVCPIPFLVRHYPIRSQAHGEQKVFVERHPAFIAAERRQGWHVQYESLTPSTKFVRDPSTLTEYDAAVVRDALALAQRAATSRHQTTRSADGTQFNWGDFGLRPVSEVWGTDRGTPVDRYYIARFLERHSDDICGRVLEVKDNGYTLRFGGDRVSRTDVLDVDGTNKLATVIADLGRGDTIADGQFDCFILTQTAHIIFDIRAALANAVRLLKPGGVLLCTIPVVSRINYEDGGLDSGDYWRLTAAAARAILEAILPPECVEVTSFGNVKVCAAFLYGLALEEIPAADFEFVDPWFPLILGVRATKPAAAPVVRISSATVGAILVYHQVTERPCDPFRLALDPDVFRQHMKHVASECQPLPLAELGDAVAHGRIPTRAVALTFDDGYLDNLTVASPILRDFGIPACFFVNTDRLTEAHETWWDQLTRIFFTDGALSTAVELPFMSPTRWPLHSSEERQSAFRKAHQHLARLSFEAREAALGELLEQTQGLPLDITHRPMLADEVADLSRQSGHTVGAHTTHHLALPVQQPAVQAAEILDCKTELEALLGKPIRSLAYPFGLADRSVADLAKMNGFSYGVVAHSEPVTSQSDLMMLPRIEVAHIRAPLSAYLASVFLGPGDRA